MSESRPDPLGLLLRETSIYPLSVREGEKPILDEPITYAEMYHRKMSKDLELAGLKKLAKEGEAKEQHDKASLEAKSTEEILAQRNLSLSAIFKSRESTEK